MRSIRVIDRRLDGAGEGRDGRPCLQKTARGAHVLGARCDVTAAHELLTAQPADVVGVDLAHRTTPSERSVASDAADLHEIRV